MVFVRVLRSHVMVRVGGGWETLAAYFSKMDPCRTSVGKLTQCIVAPLGDLLSVTIHTLQVLYLT